MNSTDLHTFTSFVDGAVDLDAMPTNFQPHANVPRKTPHLDENIIIQV